MTKLKLNIPKLDDVIAEANRKGLTAYKIHKLTGLSTETTYRYFQGQPLHPFGHGLNYSSFEYTSMELKADGKEVSVRLVVENTGKYDGDEVVQVYATKLDPKSWRPIKQLVAYRRVPLKAGEKRTVQFPISGNQLQYWDVSKQQYQVEKGIYEFQAGASSDDIRLQQTIKIR
jgi:beta-glucosidase